MVREIKGWHVLTVFVLAFGVIISVNMVLAVNAVRSFPGLEVKNSYVASQQFDRARQAQQALDWDVRAFVADGVLNLEFMHEGRPVEPAIEAAVFGRATSVANDQSPDFVFDGARFTAPVIAGAGNWNLRVVARAADGTKFQQRIIVGTGP